MIISHMVHWALERACPVRQGADWMLPGATRRELGRLQSWNTARREGRFVAGFCVTAWSPREGVDIPVAGYALSPEVEKHGGLPEVQRTCRNCEANLSQDPSEDVAGCFGVIRCYPRSDETETRLWGIIRDTPLADQLHACFQVTTPLWFGLWADSPLLRRQCEFLEKVLPAIGLHGDDDMEQFLRALERAVRWGLPMHVEMSPEGETELGWYTVLSHCPRCKTQCGGVPRWAEKLENGFHVCTVCGCGYNPADTHSVERMENPDRWKLEGQMGAEYDDFVMEFGLSQGHTAQKVREALRRHREFPSIPVRGDPWEIRMPPPAERRTLEEHNRCCENLLARAGDAGLACPHCGTFSRDYRVSTSEGRPSLLICRKCGWPMDPEEVKGK